MPEQLREAPQLGVLLVSDSLGSHPGFRAAFERAGFDCRIARGAVAAAAVQEVHPADLLVIDDELPHQSALALAMTLQLKARRPFLFVAQRMEPAAVEAAVDAGMIGHIGRPIELRSLGPLLAIARARIVEQRLLAAEIHDGIGQELAGAAWLIEALQRRWQRLHEIDDKELQSLRSLMLSIQGRCRVLAHSRFTTCVRATALIEELRRLGASASGGHFRLVYSGPSSAPPGFPDVVAHHLVRIAQEAVQNAARHSNGSRLDIDLYFDARHVTLRIIDDGSGPATTAAGRAGIGIENMCFRARLLGGTVKVDKDARGGTRVLVKLPWPQSLAARADVDPSVATVG